MGAFPVSKSQHQYKESSTALLAITFILFLGYTVVKIMLNRKTQYGSDKQAAVPQIMKNFVRVIEYDLAPSLIINFFMIGLGSFFVFAAVFSYFLLIAGAIMVVAYQKKAYKLLFILRLVIVILTFCAFLNIFVDNMTYKDAYPDLLGGFAHSNNGNSSYSGSDDKSSNGKDTSNNDDNNSTRRLI